MSPSKLTPEVWPVTSTGQPGVENLDAVLIYHPADPVEATYAGSLYAVASSKGDGERGHLASQYVVRKVMDTYYRSGEPDLGLRLREAVDAANADLFAYNQSRPELVKLPVSLTAVAVRGEQLHAASVGDGRAYLIRDNQIQRITTDHTLIQQLLDEGAVTQDEARTHPRRDVLLRTLGTQETVTVDVFDVRLHPDDALILCTSGMTHALDDEDISGVVASKSPQNAAEMLVQSARAAGSKDNIGVITALLRDGAPPMVIDLPYTWDRRPPSFEDQQTLSMPRTERPADVSAGETMVSPRVDRDSPAGQTLVPQVPSEPAPPPPIDRSAAAMQTQISGRPAMPPSEGVPQPGQSVPAPPYQANVQPAPPPARPPTAPYQPPAQPYQPPAAQPDYPPQQQGYPAQQPQYEPQPYPPAQPQGYPPQPPAGQQYAPPGYGIDPVTGLPPVPQSGQPGGQGWGSPQPAYTPRIYQPPGGPNVRPPRRGWSVGTFAIVGAGALLVVTAMVLVLGNPFGWEMPSLLAAATPTATQAPTLPPPTQPPPTTAPVAETSPQATAQPTTQAAPPGMALVAGGAFQRGVGEDEAQKAALSCIDEATDNTACLPDYFGDAQPVEQVTISPYFMDVTEVTNRAYAACVAANVCTGLSNAQFYNDPAYADHPVVFVNWEQAGTYCQWLGKRLPTEAEWEKAARWDAAAQKSYTWPWGDSFTSGVANLASSGQNGTRPVGSFPKDKSPWGMLDMGGNVTEWTGDWYFKGYAGLGTLNPTGPASQPLSEPFRAGRGGSFQALAAYARAGQRFDVPPQTAADWIGFRCAQPVAGATPPTATVTPTGEATVTPGGPTPTLTETPVP